MSAPALRRLGGRLCLDFVNTVEPRHRADRLDYISDYDALVRWATAAGALPGVDAAGLHRRGRRRPDLAQNALRRAIDLRETLYSVLSALLSERPPQSRQLALLSDQIGAAHTGRRLAPAGAPGQRLEWEWADHRTLDLPLFAVSLDADDLLTGDLLGRIHECPGTDGCGWLFLDTSKSATRRWCSMSSCGNQAKARRHRRPQPRVPAPPADLDSSAAGRP